ncbi:MAG: serine--tRNA ligase [Thermoflexales bacterium]|nr:serine--tRNA ligase [Thermoflexales bacterium]
MLDLNIIRTQPERVRQNLLDRNDSADSLDSILALDVQRREILKENEALRALRNATSKEIGRMPDAAAREARKAEMREVGDRISQYEGELTRIEAELDRLTSTLPNLMDPRAPIGPDESANIVTRIEGEQKTFDFKPREHWDLGPALGLIDFERGVKLTGSRFYVLNGLGARLQRALIAFFLNLRQAQGYQEVYLPFLVKEQTLFAAGQLPKFRDNLYHDAEEDYWLVPTAEVPITNLHGGEILDAEALPRRYAAYTPCFRREKMSAGKDTRGIKRGHQFDKVEMYTFCAPENSEAEHQKMLADAEETLKRLGLTYRVKLLATGDTGFGARLTYDLEVWAPGCQEWLEVSSVSNVGDFQARRANVKFRRERGAKAELVHTLNGSGLALPRTMIAIMENYQRADGSIIIPEPLRAFVGADVIEARG